MKSKSIGFMFVLGVTLWLLLPIVFIKLNQYLNLPVYTVLAFRVFGSVLILLALTLIIYLFTLFKLFGDGTPALTQPTKKVIDAGLYRHSRNPMYLCHLAIFLGEFFLTGYTSLLIYLMLAWLGLNFFVIRWEEPDLKRRLGQPYLEYIKRVPRWL